jgi:hypothetical protein
MNITRPVILFAFCVYFSALAAQEKFKFGNCPPELLEMTSYDKDPDAPALVTYERIFSVYEVRNESIEIVTERTVRIKILTQDGIEKFGEIALSYREGKSRAASERINGLTGNTYNLENGKIITEKLSKDYIFTEDVTERQKRIKFALPSVKIGSVIEYKYTFVSPFYYDVGDFVFQWSIPLQYGIYRIEIPEIFSFNKELKGYERVNITSERERENEVVEAEVKDMPAIKDEEYVWNYNDFRSRLTFDMRSIQVPGSYYKTFSQTWDNVVEQLNGYDDFGKQFNNRGLLKNELPIALKGKTSGVDSIRAILNLVRSTVKWNDRGVMWIGNLSKALKDGVGTSAEINAILLNALRNAGFSASPVAMSLRSRGRIPLSHPSINCFNYFIVSVSSGNTTYYLDGTKSYCDLNVIPLDCLVDKALIIRQKSFDWIDLTTVGNNTNRVNLLLTFNEEGLLTGKKVETGYGEIAYRFKMTQSKAENEEKYVESLETKNNVSISGYKLEERLTPSFGYVETYDFTEKNIRLGGDVISFNPLLFFAMKSNAFRAETRILPVEFPSVYEQRINVAITVPKEYKIDEIPESQVFFYGDNKLIELSYVVQQSGNSIQLGYRFNLRACIVPATEYAQLRDFWSKMYNKENEMITLKKITAP